MFASLYTPSAMPPAPPSPPRPTHGMVLDEFKYQDGRVDVHRRLDGRWVPWVHVGASQTPTHGRGLYALRDFAEGETVGRYTGRILGKASDVQAYVDALSCAPSGDAIVNVLGYFVDGRRDVQSNDEQLAQFGRVIMRQPDWAWPGAYVHIANDAHGTGRRNNCQVTFGGYLETLHRVPKGAELLWSYGDAYWEEEKRLGTSALPIRLDL